MGYMTASALYMIFFFYLSAQEEKLPQEDWTNNEKPPGNAN